MEIMLSDAGNVKTMSSREIAELTGKQHKNVLRDIDAIGSNLSQSSKSVTYKGYNNQTQREWLLTKRDTLLLVSGYSVELRARIIDRWQELEAQVSKPAVPQTYLEALKALVAAEEEKERLQLILQQTVKYYDVLRVVKANPDFGLDAKKLWRPLKNWCVEANVEVKKVFCPRYGSVNAYPYEAWRAVYPALELPQEAATLLEDMESKNEA